MEFAQIENAPPKLGFGGVFNAVVPALKLKLYRIIYSVISAYWKYQ